MIFTLRANIGSMVKSVLREKAIALRKAGYSYNLILEQVPVSKSTLSIWLADVPYYPNSQVLNRVRGAAIAVAQWSQKRRKDSLE